jgi:hypothetical protein
MKTSVWFQKKINELKNTDQFKAETIALVCEEKIAELETELSTLRADTLWLLRGGKKEQ